MYKYLSAPGEPRIKSVIFEAPHGTWVDPNVASKYLVDALVAAVKSMPADVHVESANAMSKLVKLMRQASKDSLFDLYGNARAGVRGMNKVTAR